MKIAEMIHDAALLGAVLSFLAGVNPAMAQPTTNRPARPTPPTRDPHTPGFIAAKELPNDTVPPADADGNFILGPTHHPAPEMTTNVPQGMV
jgi:hypothetical protein